MNGPLQHLWRNSEREGLTMSTQELAQRARRFDGSIRRRNWIEYAASALVIAIFGWMAVDVPETIVKIGCLAIIAGTLVVVRNLHRHGPAARFAADLSADCRAFYRTELVRQRDALRSVSRWYLAPLLPGLVLFHAGSAYAMAEHLPATAVAAIFAAGIAVIAALFAGIRRLNHRAADRLDAEIARLDG